MKMNNIGLGIQTHYSCGRAVGDVEQYKNTFEEKNFSHVAFADFKTFGGALDFYNTFKKTKIKFALGLILEINGKSFITLFCRSQKGYYNLCKLTTKSNRLGHVLSINDLYELKDDLYCLTNDLKQREELEAVFGNDLFFEVIPYYEFKENNLRIFNEIDASRIVVSTKAKMPLSEDRFLFDIMIENSSFGKTKNFVNNEETKFLMTTEEVIKKLVIMGHVSNSAKILEGIKNSRKLIENCSELNLKFKDQIVNYPHLLHSLNYDGCDKETLLRRIIKENKKFDFDNPIYKERLDYEIDTIARNSRVNLIDYFLVVEDFVRYCKKNNVPVGPGRGSGAGSLVVYGLDITQLDPIEHGLIFERFISKGRIEAGTLPDLDLDFSDQEFVINYLKDFYGESRVKPIGTYQTLAVRGAIKDAFRILYPEADFLTVNFINKSLDDNLESEGGVDFFEQNLEKNEAFQKMMEPYPRVIEAVKKLVGYNRQSGRHPCGVSITQDPVEEIMPLKLVKGQEVIEFSAEFCEQSGVIKFDILGLKTLKFFMKCLGFIKERYEGTEKELNSIYDIPLNDQKTLLAFDHGDTESCFQFNSDVAQNILKRIKTTSLDDLAMVTSVGRPGPMENGQHFEFIKRKNSPELSVPPHRSLEETLKATFGVMIYQESVMRVGQILGGYSLVETDDIRRAMGKKKIEVILKYKERFIKNCEETYPDTKIKMIVDGEQTVNLSEHIWHLMETFSGYGFNKSHAMCYAYIGYMCQYLKTHYPFEWWAACLTHSEKPEILKRYYSAFKENIDFPMINVSQKDYFIDYEKKKIIMPLSCIKSVADKATESICENSPFSSFEDFFNRVNKRVVNIRVILNLINAGAFESFGHKAEIIKDFFKLRKEKIEEVEDIEQILDFSKEAELKKRIQVLDFLVMDYIDANNNLLKKCIYYEQIKTLFTDEKAWTVGKIIDIKKRKIKKGKSTGKDFAIVEITNNDSVLSFFVWPEQLALYKDKIMKDEVVCVFGVIKKDKENKTLFTSIAIHTLEEVKQFGGLSI